MAQPWDVVLNLVSGMYGRGYGDWARRYALEVIEIEVPYDSSVPAVSVADAFRLRPDITVVCVVHCETPSGTVNDLDAISAVVAEHGALLIVDAVSTFGGIRCDFTAWQAGLVVTAPQKCLGGTAGLSLLHVSEAAWEHMASNPAAPRGSVLSILDWRHAHLADRPFPFTPSVTDIYGLRACLEQYLLEGAEAVLGRHRAAARAVRAGAEALGLTLWARDPAIRSDTVTAVRVPAGIDERELRARARAESGVMLSGGQGDLSGIVLQIGHMGPGAYPLGPVIAVTALGRAACPGRAGRHRRRGGGRRIGPGTLEPVAEWTSFRSAVPVAMRLMQNPAVNSSAGPLARLLRKFPTRLTNTKQRLLRPVERRFPRQTFPSRRSRCGSSVCQDWTKSNSANLNAA